MTETPNIKLKKPGETDSVDQRIFNDNSDVLDKEISAIQKTQSEQKTAIAKTVEQAAVNKSSLGLQKKNLAIPNPALQSYYRGVTITRDENGVITLNGIVEELGTNIFGPRITPFLFFKEGQKLTLSGCMKNLPDGVDLSLLKEKNGSISAINASDVGEGTTFTIPETGKYYYVRIRANNGTAFQDAVFQPMLRYAEITDDTYEPYQLSLQEQIDELRSQLSELKGLNTASALLPEKQLYVVETPEEEIVESEVE